MSQTRRALILWSLLITASVPAVVAPAAVPGTVAFQGHLSDTGGQPLNASASLVFSVYGAASGGSALWTEAHPAVAVADGVFAVSLGSLVPFTPAVAQGGPRFLGIAVNGEPELPRVALQSTLFALRAAAADTVTAAIAIKSGGFSTFEVSANPAVSTQLQMIGNFSPFTQYVRLGPSEFEGMGANLTLGSDSGLANAYLDSDYLGGGRLELLSAGAFIDLWTDPPGSEGDDTVRLPVGAVNALETRDEPGLAAAHNTGFVSPTATIGTMISRTIGPPADGYVLALGQCVARITHTTGTATTGAVGLSDDGITFGSAQDINLQIPSGAASGAYSLPAHFNGVFTALAGQPLTIHIVANETSGVIDLEDLSLTLLYVPTLYGSVSPTLLAQADGESAPARGALSPGEILAEKLASQEADAARLERELAAMREAHAVLRAELESRQAIPSGR